MRIFTQVLFFSFFSAISLKVNATICTSVADGNWSAPETWDCGMAPGCGDTIYINHLVTVDVNVDIDETPGCPIPTFITISATGTLDFDMGKKLSLACGSGISIEPGGQITASSYSGSNNFINICSDPVWIASDGPQSGPLVFGSGLPIELLFFDAYLNNENVHLTWATVSETNNDYFIIQKSANGVDWIDIIQTDGAGNSNSLINYFEIDYTPLVGTNYYRLKQVDFNGHFTFSQIKVVKTYNQLAGEIALYPNPCDGFFHIQLGGFGDEEFLVVVRDLAGREDYSKVVVTSTDNHIEAFDLSGQLAPGTYIITASNRNEFYSQKLVVK